MKKKEQEQYIEPMALFTQPRGTNTTQWLVGEIYNLDHQRLSIRNEILILLVQRYAVGVNTLSGLILDLEGMKSQSAGSYVHLNTLQVMGIKKT